MNTRILDVPLPLTRIAAVAESAEIARREAAEGEGVVGILRPLANFFDHLDPLIGDEDDPEELEATHERVREFVQAVASAGGLDPEVAWDQVSMGVVDEEVTGRDEIIARVAALESIEVSEATRLVDRATDSILRTLVREERYEIPGVGSFALRRKPGREGRNPQTGERIEIAARTIVTFRADARATALTRSPNAEEAGLVLSVVTDALTRCHIVYLPRIGRFIRRRAPRRMGRNPRTGEEVMIEEKEHILFSVSRELRAALLAADAR